MMMTLHTSNKCDDEIQELPQTKKFLKLLDQLECYAETEQKQKIEEMNGLIDEMNQKEFELTFTEVLFNKIYELIKEKKLHCENAILLLKRIGCCLTLKNVWNRCFEKSMLSKRFEKMIIEEDQKKEGKNEKLLAGLCECYLLCKHFSFEEELLSICIPHVLKIASNKEEGIEVQKEVEMALFALRSISSLTRIEKDQFVNEIKEIIEHHQKHQNLTRLAYQSAWQFLTKRFYYSKSLEDLIMNELHFTSEASRELDELVKSLDLKGKGGSDRLKETRVILRWLDVFDEYFDGEYLRRNDDTKLIKSIIGTCRAEKGNDKKIANEVIQLFGRIAGRKRMNIKYLLDGGAVDHILNEIKQPSLTVEKSSTCLWFFYALSERLKGESIEDFLTVEKEDEIDEAEKKDIKKEIIEKYEEEGLEDCVFSFSVLFFKLGAHNDYLSENPSDYTVLH